MPRRTPQPPRRRFRRCTLRVLVDYVTQQGVRCEYATTLGAGGMFIETESPLAVATPLRVRFRLPGGGRVHEIVGRVAWRQEPTPASAARRAPGMAVEFTDAVATSTLARELDRVD